ncbi:MAG: M23 family metallopeptidase [bacterium]
MTSNNQRASHRRKQSQNSQLLAEPKSKEIFSLLLEDLRARTLIHSFRQLVHLAFSYMLILLYGKIAPASRRFFRRIIPRPLIRAAQSVTPLATRLGALTVSTSLVFILCVSIGILSPASTRSGSDEQEVKLGAILLPPGEEDTISDSDGYVNPESTRFAEPPPNDFGEIPLPSAESFPFESSPVFLGGDSSEESISYIAKTSEQLKRTQEIPDLPAFKAETNDSSSIASESEDGSDSLPVDAVARHVVSPGENLWQICQKYDMKMGDVIAYNNISDPSRLRPGLELFLPGANVPSGNQVLRFPLDEIEVTSGYGMRMHPILHRRLFHVGVDLRAKRGTPVYAAADGTVEFAHRSYGRGNTIVINHGNGYKTVYAHLQTMSVKTGKRVKAGQRIAKSGRTGRTTGPHLHFEVWRETGHINPLTALPPIPGSRKYSQR